MALPFLPGNHFNRNLGKTSYHKSHHFEYSNDVPILGDTKPGIGGDPLPGQRKQPRNSAIPRGNGPDLPAWVAFDRQVLCFDAYFREAVHEKKEEQFRVRHCKIYFYLEDDSIQVIEPRLKNAGIPQGTLIRRHRIPRPPPYDDEFYTVEDFNVGNQITLYSKTFFINGCDKFTSNFLGKLGVRVNQPVGADEDPYMSHRKAMDESMQPLRPYEKQDTLKQFLDHDRHVLRFYCFWDDTDNMFGDPREMVLHYFLADDTIEIREIIPPNAGRDATPMFVRRSKLPKNVANLKQPGEITDRTVLNVFGPMGHGGRYILDSLKTGAVHQEFYNDQDLTLGAAINVWGRKFVVCDCDEFTKEYYRSKYGITDFTPIPYKQNPDCKAARDLPPYNGWGSEEDSLRSCQGLLPKPPKRDFIKFMEKDRHGLDSNILRFLAKIDTTKPIDMDRRFIISYYLSDDTIQVFETAVRNSGMSGGKFLERGRVKKPNQPNYSTEMSEYYGAQDLQVGAGLVINNHRFLLLDADEYAYNYMERHPDEFSQANIQSIMNKVYQLVRDRSEEFSRSPTAAPGAVTFEEFRRMILAMTEGQLTEHEVITLARHYQDHKDDNVSINTLVAIVQEQLRKSNFEHFSKIREQCVHQDKERLGFLDVDSLRTVCHALKIPLQDDLIRALISKMPTNTLGHINYNDFVQRLNWRDHPEAPLPSQTSRMDEAWQGNKTGVQVQNINFQALIQDLSSH